MNTQLKSRIFTRAIQVPKLDGQNSPLDVNGNLVWKDLKANFEVRGTSGTNNPTFEQYIPGFYGYVFSGTTMTQVWVDFHFDHDIAMNTKIFPHVHWMPMTTNTGTVRWGFQYIVAKGHGQSMFPTASNTIYVDHPITQNSQYMHMVTEVPEGLGILSSEIEPDSVIKFRVFREGNVDSHNGKVHAWQADLHYQVGRIGTVSRSPNFFVKA